MACAWLGAALDDPSARDPAAGFAAEVEAGEWEAVCGLVASGVNSPLTTSAGRLFDAVAALCGLRARVEHEGQAAPSSRGSPTRASAARTAFPLVDPGGDAPAILDPRQAIRALGRDLGGRRSRRRVVAARFHNGLADAAPRRARARPRRGVGSRTASSPAACSRTGLLLERAAAGCAGAGSRC